MKLISVLLFFCFSQVNGQAKKMDLDDIRINYAKSVSDKKLCEQMIKEIGLQTPSPVLMCYLGGLQTIWAQHVFNPFQKMQTFKKGKINIEKAIQQERDNPEMRYIRLSIQENAPSILGYHSDIQNDRVFLQKHLSEITSEVVRRNIEILLKN